MNNDVDPEEVANCNIYRILGLSLTDTFMYKKIMLVNTLPIFHTNISDYNVMMANVCLLVVFLQNMSKTFSVVIF